MKKLLLLLIAATLSLSAKAQEYVDLGLSVNWATCDVGANTPYEAGTIFIVGTAIEARSVNFSTKHYMPHQQDISGNPQYDAATANLGSEWRTPTYTEWSELMASCTWVYEKLLINGETIKGFKITGPNGNSIFMHTFTNGVIGVPTQRLCSTPNATKKGKMWVFMDFRKKHYMWTPGKGLEYGWGAVRAVRDK